MKKLGIGILRAPLNLDKGSEKDDLEDSATHRAVFDNEKIVGIGRLHFIDKNKCPNTIYGYFRRLQR